MTLTQTLDPVNFFGKKLHLIIEMLDNT